jgi:HD-GYP domain-containing protein (c-di-GMP phosphodiesterase class II)
VFLSYLREIFPDEFKKVFLRIVQAFSALLVLFVMAAPPLVFEKSLGAFQAATVISGMYSLYILVLSGIHGRESAGILLRGFLFLFIFVINDILYTNQIINTGHLLPWGQVIFLLSQAYLIARLSAQTYKKLKKTNDMLAESRLGIILGLAKLAEYRDEETGIHLERIREYSRMIAEYLSHLPAYQDYITAEYIEDIYQSSILHDIGKVGIPDAILLKPGRLTPEEFEIIKGHSRLGGDAIHNVEAGMNARSFLTLGKQVAYSHHERWNGKGYPDGTSGRDIPLSARIVALADVYDALTSARSYKPAFSHQKSREIILSDRGMYFDPDVVDAFIAKEAEFERIRREMDERNSSSPVISD